MKSLGEQLLVSENWHLFDSPSVESPSRPLLLPKRERCHWSYIGRHGWLIPDIKRTSLTWTLRSVVDDGWLRRTLRKSDHPVTESFLVTIESHSSSPFFNIHRLQHSQLTPCLPPIHPVAWRTFSQPSRQHLETLLNVEASVTFFRLVYQHRLVCYLY